MSGKILIGSLVATILLLVTTAAQADECKHLDSKTHQMRKCTAKEQQHEADLQYYEMEAKKQMAEREEQARIHAAREKIRFEFDAWWPTAGESVGYVFIASVVPAALAFVIGMGWSGLLGSLLIVGVTPLSLFSNKLMSVSPERPFLPVFDSWMFEHHFWSECFIPLLPFEAGVLFLSFGIYNLQRHRKDCLFSVNEERMEYSRHGLCISVNQEKLKVIVNGIEISLDEFSSSHHKTEKLKTYNTGGSRNVYGSGGVVGTVYVPGQSGSYPVHVGNEVTVYKQGEQREQIANAKFTLHKKAVSSYEALLGILEQIKRWCDQEAQKKRNESKKNALEAAQNSFAQLCQQAGISQDCFNICGYDTQGKLTQTLAVDRAGKAFAVYNNGAETWMGSLQGASAQIVDDKLELKVDDAAYREKHLTERRITLLEGEKREVLVEWEDRINLLAKNLSASA